MIPLFHEYDPGHPRFREHLRVASLTIAVAPAGALLLLPAQGWGNAWLWATCGVGLALAMMLHGVVAMHRRPEGLSATGNRWIADSATWFSSFFIVIQSCIAALIVLFVWFNLTAWVIDAPFYAHLILIGLALLFPVRRFLAAQLHQAGVARFYRQREMVRALWHVLMTVFITRSIIGLTITDLADTSPENTAWQIILWVPASLYMLLVVIVMVDHLRQSGVTNASVPVSAAPSPPPAPEADRL
ncbi:MAG TPA: hypothetical protein PKE26_05725 [Kiritimatiellia bacterium]|nr:hypothetical protein [Kiritimatiellia bacterium]HMO98592.1 hypothetical protein [Kiritimatiellia bacterium]HMP95429.1 hypothetical protein [Kiritimatiellia bacterium]